MSCLRDKILNMLKESGNKHLSGERMARQLSVSRTAVWKNINTLQEEGYIIEGSPRLGYRLIEIPDLLLPGEITNMLNTDIIAADTEQVYYYKVVDSTNQVLKRLSEQGAEEGSTVIAEEQTKGQGRIARSWYSPGRKNIYLSLLLTPRVSPQEIPSLSLLSAVAVTKGIKQILPDLPLGIKWPNDLLINKRKVCGILIDIKAEAELLHHAIIGIGINVNLAQEDFPPELKKTATSLCRENNNKEVPRSKLAASILQELDNYYLGFLNKGIDDFMEEWKKNNITLGQIVSVSTARNVFSGRARDIDKNGALLVEDENGSLVKCLAGEVSLSPARSQ